jgi:hypothetical protein
VEDYQGAMLGRRKRLLEQKRVDPNGGAATRNSGARTAITLEAIEAWREEAVVTRERAETLVLAKRRSSRTPAAAG